MRRNISHLITLLSLIFLISACNAYQDEKAGAMAEQKDSRLEYFDQSGRTDLLSGGVRMIPIETPSGTFRVWTKRTGNNPRMKLLLLHGGPGLTHEYLECFDSYLPAAGIEYYYYDQLESAYSDQPGDTSLWNTEHFVEEVEQVRKALGLDNTNFYLFGHSWGGMLAMEYALKYQENLKGMIISNMMASIPDYVKYGEEVLAPQMDPDVLKEIRGYEKDDDYTNPEYLELISTYYYPVHLLRMPLEEWPDPVMRALNHTNYPFYLAMQGPSEMGVVGDARLKYWSRKDDLDRITIPTLTIGGRFDTMDPEYMEWMATQFRKGSYLYCPNGSHLAMYDDQETYMNGLIDFIWDVDSGHSN